MTISEAKRSLSTLNLTLHHSDGEFRVNYRNGQEDTAYYTNDLDDAVGTGVLMAQIEDQRAIDRAQSIL